MSVYRGNNWPGESKIRIQKIREASPPISGSFDIHAYGHTLKGTFECLELAEIYQSCSNTHVCSV